MTSFDPTYYTEGNLKVLIDQQNLRFNIAFAFLLPFNVLAFYLILFHSKAMHDYKYYVLYFQLTCFFCDLNMAVATKIFSFFPLPFVCFNGLLTEFDVSTHAQLCIVAFFLEVTGASVNCCFLYRHQVIAGIRKVRKLGRRGYFLAILAAHFWLTCIIFYVRPSFPKEKMFNSLKEKYPFAVGVSNYGFILFEQDDVQVCLVYNGFVALVNCGQVVFCVVDSVHQLNEGRSSMSAKTRRQQMNFLIALFFQVMIPVSVGVGPTSCVFLCILLDDWSMRDLTVTSLWLMATHSIFSTTAMLLTTPHYWRTAEKFVKACCSPTAAKTELSISVNRVRVQDLSQTSRLSTRRR